MYDSFTESRVSYYCSRHEADPYRDKSSNEVLCTIWQSNPVTERGTAGEEGEVKSLVKSSSGDSSYSTRTSPTRPQSRGGRARDPGSPVKARVS